MAESYRGLTIRIGGDVSGLSKALRGANSAIRATDSQLRALGKAMQLDPKNARAAELQVGAIAAQAVNVSTKLSTVKRALEEMGQVDVGGQSLGEFVAGTENIRLAAERARDAYASVDDELARMYQRLNDLSEKSGTVELFGKFNAENSSVAKITAALSEFTKQGQISSQEADNLGKRIVALKARHVELADEMSRLEMAESFEKAIVEATSLDSRLTDLSRTYSELSGGQFSRELAEIDAELATINVASSVATDRFEKLDAALRVDPRNVDLAKQRAQALQEAAGLAQRNVAVLKGKLETLSTPQLERAARETRNVSLALETARAGAERANKAVAILAGEYEDLTRAAKQYEAIGVNDENRAHYDEIVDSLGRVKTRLEEAQKVAEQAQGKLNTAKGVQEIKNLEAAIAEGEATARSFDAQLNTTFQERFAAGVIAASALGNAIREAFNSAISAARDVDSAYRDMRKTVNATESEYESLKQAAIEFSKTHVTSAEQMLEIEALAGQFGIGVENLQSFAESISNLDIATDINAEEAALRVGQMINVLKDFNPEDTDRFSDALVRLGNNVPATESAIMNISQRISSIGGVIGLTTPQVLAWSAALASTGQKSESAATALANTMTQIESAVSGGGEELEKFAEIAGMSAKEFTDAWDKAPSDALRNFIDGLAALDMTDKSVVATLEELGISAVRQEQALLGLKETVGTLDDSLLMSQNAWDGVSDEWGMAGDAANEAARKMEGISGALAKYDNTMQALAAEFGEGMLPIIQGGVEVLQGLVGVIQSLDPEVKTLVMTIGSMAVATAVAVPIVGGLASAWKPVFTVIKDGLSTLSPFAIGLAGISAALYPFLKAIEGNHKHVNGFNSAMERMAATSNNAASIMRDGEESFEQYGRGARTARADIDGLIDSIHKHQDAIESSRDAAVEQTAQLTSAQEILERLSGQTKLTAKEQGELEWALALVNEQLGLNITKEDVIRGTYEDEEGAIHNLKDSLNQLIQKRKEEAQVAALTDMYTESLKSQYEAQREYEAAQRHYNELFEEYASRAENAGKSQEELRVGFLSSGAAAMEASVDYQEAGQVLTAATEESNALATELGFVSSVSDGTGDALSELALSSNEMRDAFLRSGQNAGVFLDSLRGMGITADDLNKLDLSGFVAAYDGSIASILEYISQYNAAHVDDKEAQIQVETVELTDADGKVYTWNGTELVEKETGIKVEGVVELDDGTGKLLTWNGTAFESKTASISLNGTSSIERAIALADKWNNFQLHDKSASMAVRVTGTQLAFNAAGGHIPRHADGFIATRPTLTDYGWIGENGVEAYTGNALVPLTNTRYSQPFIDLLADGVISKLGNINSGPTYQVYFNDVEVNSDDAFASAFQNLMYEAARKADM